MGLKLKSIGLGWLEVGLPPAADSTPDSSSESCTTLDFPMAFCTRSL